MIYDKRRPHPADDGRGACGFLLPNFRMLRIQCTDMGNVCFEVACINNAPTIEAEPVRHGRWIQTTLKGYYECSACGYEHTSNPDQRFCSYCGARMDATDTNVGGKGDKEMDLSPLDFLAAEYDRKHPQGIRFVDCMEGADDGACKKV